MKLIFCEKPSMGRDIARVLNITDKGKGCITGKEYSVTWAAGHFVGLASPEAYGIKTWSLANLPILPAKFMLQEVMPEGKKDKFISGQLQVIKKLFAKCSEIIVATDAGREGELIFRYIYEYLDCKKPFKRLWTASLTDGAIKKAFAELRPGREFDALYYSARARSQADWLVGINCTQALTLRLNAPKGKSISAGRVQSPTLCLICARYLENMNFVKAPFWKISLQVKKNEIAFFAVTEPYSIEQEAVASFNAAKAYFEHHKSAVVVSVEQKQKKEAPPLLHDLASLQKKANNLYGLAMEETQAIAQSLYEKKHITYPRTGSKYIPADVFELIPARINDVFTQSPFNTLKESYNFRELYTGSVNDKKVTDHHAIITTENIPAPSSLNNNEALVYRLIQIRLLQAFAEVCHKDVTTAVINMAIDFYAKGSITRHKGWRVYEEIISSGASTEEISEEDRQLPELINGDHLKVIDMKTEKSFTKPRPLYTDATIISAMENCGKEIPAEEEAKKGLSAGIGTPATRSQIIKTLYDRVYIKKDGKKIMPTEHGLAVYNKIKDLPFSDVILTGKWENALSYIEAGQLPEDKFVTSIKQFATDCVTEITNL